LKPTSAYHFGKYAHIDVFLDFRDATVLYIKITQNHGGSKRAREIGENYLPEN
jgi:hypothetical protein